MTDHPQAAEAAARLLPWLDEVGCDAEIDPIEREELATPLGDMSESQRADVNWAGEAAAFFSWTIGLGSALDRANPADQSALIRTLRILHDDAQALHQNAAFRPANEIEDACRQFVLIQSTLRQSRISSPAKDIIARMGVQTLADVGIAVSEKDINRAAATVAAMTAPEQSRAGGIYFVRVHAALWLFDDRPRYFEEE